MEKITDTILLPETLKVSEIQQILEEVKTKIPIKENIKIDFQQLQNFDASGMQLILLLKKMKDKKNKIEFINFSENIHKKLLFYGYEN